MFGRRSSGATKPSMSSKQTTSKLKGGFQNFGQFLAKTVKGVEESEMDQEVVNALASLKTIKSELEDIIRYGRGVIDGQRTVKQSSDSLNTSLTNVERENPDSHWVTNCTRLGRLLNTVQLHSDMLWDRIQNLMSQLAGFYEGDVMTANDLKREFKTAKFEFDEAVTALGKAKAEQQAEKQRVRDDKEENMKQMRQRLLTTIANLQSRLDSDIANILAQYFEAMSHYFDESVNATNSQAGPITEVVPQRDRDRGSYVFGSASAPDEDEYDNKNNPHPAGNEQTAQGYGDNTAAAAPPSADPFYGGDGGGGGYSYEPNYSDPPAAQNDVGGGPPPPVPMPPPVPNGGNQQGY